MGVNIEGNEKDPLEPIQRMHDIRLVTREAIIAWYEWYAHKLPRMKPQRSDADLVRTVSLWIELTDRGGTPAFPYDYRSDLNLPSAHSVMGARPSPWWRLGTVVLLAGIVTAFFNVWLGLALVAVGGSIWVLGYKVEGGPTSMASIGKEGLRVLRWSEEHQTTAASDGSCHETPSG